LNSCSIRLRYLSSCRSRVSSCSQRLTASRLLAAVTAALGLANLSARAKTSSRLGTVSGR